MSPTEDAVKAASKTDLPVLEGLRLALGSLEDPKRPWDFYDWTQCTCGHIYAGAHRGKMTDDEDKVDAPPSLRSRYGKMLAAVVEANDLTWDPEDGDGPQEAISNATAALAKETAAPDIPDDQDKRDAAIVLIRKTIEHVEDEQRAAMLDVAGAR